MENKVWFTYKARIYAHKRLTRLDFHSQLLLVWYAIISTCVAVLVIRYPQALGKDTDILTAFLSIVLLGISLAITNRDFRGRALSMQKNYLELQSLYNDITIKSSTTATIISKYDDLLAAVENHHEIDDKVFRVLNKNNLTSRNPNFLDTILVYSYFTIRFLAVLMLYLAPFIIWFIVSNYS